MDTVNPTSGHAIKKATNTKLHVERLLVVTLKPCNIILVCLQLNNNVLLPIQQSKTHRKNPIDFVEETRV